MKRQSKKQSTTSNGGSWHSTPLTFDQYEAMFNRQKYFHDPQCFFTFPPDPSPNLLPEYHFIEGFSIFCWILKFSWRFQLLLVSLQQWLLVQPRLVFGAASVKAFYYSMTGQTGPSTNFCFQSWSKVVYSALAVS